MRVLHVIPSLAAAHGGPSNAMRLMESALRTRGLDIEIATTDDDGAGGHVDRALEQPIREEGGVRRYFHRTLRPYKVSLSLAFWLRRHAGDYDLIHVHALFSFASTVAAWAAWRAGVPYVLRPLGTLASYGMARRRPWLKRVSFEFVESRLLRRAAAVHFTSDAERHEAEALGVTMRGVVLPLAVAPMLTAPPEVLWRRFPELQGIPYVLFLSRIDPKKNIENLLRAIPACMRACPDARWLIAGDGSQKYVESLATLSRELGVAERVIWAGHLDGAVKAAALQGAALFVLPSFSENFGIAAAEALQAGLPVVLGEGVALAALAADACAGIVSAPDPLSISEAMSHYLLDPQRRASAGQNARTLASREFSPETMAERLESLYTALVALRQDQRREPRA